MMKAANNLFFTRPDYSRRSAERALEEPNPMSRLAELNRAQLGLPTSLTMGQFG
jgi:hypothetical protein